MPFLDKISITIMSVLGGFGIMCNILLLAAIKFRSPPSLKSYSILLANCALIDLIACVTSTLCIERMIAFRDMTVNVYLGPCSLFSGVFCHILHSIMIQTNNQSMYLIVMEAFFRYYVVTRSPPKSLKVFAVCFAIFLPTFVAVILTFTVNDHADIVREAMRISHPEYSLDNYIAEGHVDSGQFVPPKSMPQILPKAISIYYVVPVIPMIIIVLIMRQKIISKLEEKREAMTSRTREMHGTLVKVITLRASLPIFFILSVICFVVMKYNILNAIWIQYAIGWFHVIMPSLAPVITLTNVKPFRNFVLCKGQPIVIASTMHLESLDKNDRFHSN